MQELISQITSKIGISPEQAQGAMQMVLGFVKDKLPAPLHGTIDSLLGGQAEGQAEGQAAAAGGEAESEGGVGDLLEKAKGALGGFFK